MKKLLIVGLGNVGETYSMTRHNIGFYILNALARELDLEFKTEKLGDVVRFKYRGKSFTLLKPNTYMNLSGKAVKYWLTHESIRVENLCVVTDDIHIDFGVIRIKTKGSSHKAGTGVGSREMGKAVGGHACRRFGYYRREGVCPKGRLGYCVHWDIGGWGERGFNTQFYWGAGPAA